MVLRTGRRVRAGFTLLELLAVIVIIGLLIALLVPAVGTIRSNAKRVATSSAFSSIGTGLEAFRAEQRIGGAYPPSASDGDGSTGNPAHLEVRNPYRGGAYGNTPPATIPMGGAGLLVWAMAGADRLGTAGFHKFRSGSTSWSTDSDSAFQDADNCGAYALFPDNNSNYASRAGQPARPRAGPYIELDKIQMTSYDTRARAFLIKAEVKARGTTANMPPRPYPMFLDTFGFPILYYRADPAGNKIADQDPHVAAAAGANRGIYHWEDNSALVSNAGGNDPLKLVSGANAHRLEWQNLTGTASDPLPNGTFAAYIQNKDIKAKRAPHRSDSYLLISPGEDGVYGTGDDITNFPHNGQ